jgi:hypothetical protein
MRALEARRLAAFGARVLAALGARVIGARGVPVTAALVVLLLTAFRPGPAAAVDACEPALASGRAAIDTRAGDADGASGAGAGRGDEPGRSASMDLVPILAAVALIATLSTLLLCLSPYMTLRARQKRGPRAVAAPARKVFFVRLGLPEAER